MVMNLLNGVLEVTPAFGERSIKYMRRLGKKEEMRERPLLVSLEDNQMKRQIFNKINRAKGHAIYDKIGVKNDETPKQREEYKDMKHNVDKKNQEQRDFWYKIRGPPWDRRVVQSKRNHVRVVPDPGAM